MCSGWRGQIPAPLGLHRVLRTFPLHNFPLYNALSPTVHLNGSNGTAYTRPSMVQNRYFAIRGGNPSRDYQIFPWIGGGGAGFEPRHTALHSGALSLSHLLS
jgi:hypothetical protein